MSLLKSKELMRGTLALILITAFMVALSWLFEQPIPVDNTDLVTFMLGQLSVLAAQGVNYYLGTSKSSTDKTEAMHSDPRFAPTPKPDDPRPLAPGGDLPHPEYGQIDNPEEGNPT